MNATKPALIRLWSDVVTYAKWKCAAYGVNASDVDDIVIDAYEKAREKLRHTKVRKNRVAAIKAIAWCSVINELKRQQTERACVMRTAVRLDAEAAVAGEDAPSVDLSDHGRGARAVRESNEESGESCDWRAMTREQIARERNDCRRVVTLLMKERMTKAQQERKLRLPRSRIDAILIKLRTHFDLCFQAYLACRAKKAEDECV